MTITKSESSSEIALKADVLRSSFALPSNGRGAAQSNLSPNGEIPRLSRLSSSTFLLRMTFGTFVTVRQSINGRRS